MNIKVYVDRLKEWITISSDEVLDRTKNLSDLPDKDQAISNLGLYEKFVSKEALNSGFLPSVFNANNIIQDTNHKFVTDEQIESWSNKINKVIIYTQGLENGQIGYNSSNGKFYIGINGEDIVLGGRSAFDNREVYTGTFNGDENPTIIRNTYIDLSGQVVAPLYVSVQANEFTAGTLGEVSVSFDENYIKVYNTGSFRGAFSCMAVYP